MSYIIELEKLTDEQLEAFKVIDPDAYKEEKENRATYSDEEMKRFQIYTDLDKAYFYLKPMYDNMRNNDVKKTITESGILTTLEKVFRWTKKKNVTFKRYEQPVQQEEIPAFVVTHDMVRTVEPTPAPAPVIPNPEPVAEQTPAPEPVAEQTPGQSPLENMSTEELNKIMASIPAVEKI